jgi:hypothetical protein
MQHRGKYVAGTSLSTKKTIPVLLATLLLMASCKSLLKIGQNHVMKRALMMSCLEMWFLR